MLINMLVMANMTDDDKHGLLTTSFFTFPIFVTNHVIFDMNHANSMLDGDLAPEFERN